MTVAGAQTARLQIVSDPVTGRKTYLRECDRCPQVRVVRDPRSKRNLCRDCLSVLGKTERARWAA